jgi:hypothetical protein
MKSMFTMGFEADVFGARMPSPMLGRVPIRGMGQTTPTDGDALLKQMQNAETQVAAVNQYIAAHPNLQIDLAGDYAGFQQNLQVLADAANTETAVSGQLQATAPGQQYQITSGDLATVQNYISAAAALTQIIANHPGASGAPAATTPTLTPGARPATAPKPAVPAPASAAKPDLTTPLLVGGGILTVGLLVLLARA